MIAFVAQDDSLRPGRALELRQPHLLPGKNLHEVISRRHEHHLHAFALEQRAQCTLTLQAPEQLVLRILTTGLRPLGDPGMRLQEVLERGEYWAHVTWSAGARILAAPYCLKLHCVPL